VIPAQHTRQTTIKGYRDGLLVTLGEGDWSVERTRLFDQIAGQAAFFQGARMALDVGSQVVHAAEMGRLRERLSDLGVILTTVISDAPQTAYSARMLGLATSIHSEKSVSAYNPARGGLAQLVKETLLAGMKVESDTDLVILGNVPVGVQLEAHGSIVVWGKLLGTVHAGIGSNEDAVVSALLLRPVRLRIAGMLYPQRPRFSLFKPETARIQNGDILIEPWNKRR